MKKTFLFVIFAFLASWNSLQAQKDYLIIMDDGSTMSDTKWAEMKTTTVNLIQRLLACNPKNKYAIAHYGAGDAPVSGYEPKVYIEMDFTHDNFVEKYIKRRLQYGQHFHEALGILGDALDGNFNPAIVSPQTSLNREPTFEFNVILITDGSRNVGDLSTGSYLVNYNNTTLNDPGSFKNVSLFKIQRNAKFAVIHLSPDAQSSAAGASIASAGGFYTGPVESNIDDPDYGVLPRMYFPRPQTFLYLYGGNTIEEDFERIVNALCDPYGGKLDFFYEHAGCAIPPTVYLGGHFTLPPGGYYQGSKLAIRSLDTGTDYPITVPPNFISPNNFVYTLYPADLNLPPGATGKYKFIMSMYVNGPYELTSWNNYPFYDWDLDLDATCTRSASGSIKNKEGMLKISPNPTDGLFKVILDKEIESGLLEIKDMHGNTVLSKRVKKLKEIDADISRQNQGIYIINITSDKNETYSGKIIKK